MLIVKGIGNYELKYFCHVIFITIFYERWTCLFTVFKQYRNMYVT